MRRPDHAFFGIGPTTLEGDRSRYGEDRVDATATFDVPLWRASHVKADSGLRSVSLYDGHFGHDPSVEQQVAAGVFPAAPYGFDRGYTAEYNSVVLTLDSRKSVPSGLGVRLEVGAEQGSDVRQASGGVDPLRRDGGRLLGPQRLRPRPQPLRGGALRRPARPAPIPFTELVSLGGDL